MTQKINTLNIFLIGLILIIGLTGCSKQENSNNQNTNSNAEKMGTNIVTDNSTQKNVTEIKKNATGSDEITISEFNTKIYNKEEARQTNVRITCGKLNGTIVKAGNTFSFEAVVGKATTADGYKEADIFDKDGNKIKGLGGGNCQVSTTLYNAVLKTENLEVTERHEHSNTVPYIEDGRDAAVAYGSCDFKFINNNSYDIKIYTEALEDSVNIRITRI